MNEAELQNFYHEVLDRVLNDELRLPSLPDVTMKVREAVAAENTTCESLTEIIAKDPGLTAYLVRAASSPVYRRAVPPTTLSEVVGLLGFAATNSLVMLHSIRSLVSFDNPVATKLFNHTWERLVVKTSVASFFCQHLKYRSIDQVQMAMLLTEVGSLSVLSAMLEGVKGEDITSPDTDVYFQMCRKYSKEIGCAVLKKWKIDETIISMLADCGNWEKTWEEKLNLLDIANLALYNTVLLTSKNPTLPELPTLAVFSKLPEPLREFSKPNWLSVVADNQEDIQAIIASFK
ncbi:MAG: HDOD domain-containing protein [Cellvibrionaceae bacterium]